MMTDKIEPALSAEEWEEIRDCHDLVRWTVDESGLGIRGTIAMLNAALPDGDPRKITREKCNALRHGRIAYPEGSASWREIDAIADALESYLPPETANGTKGS